MPIFLILILPAYVLISTYLFIRGWQTFPSGKGFRLIYTILYWTTALSYLFNRIFEHALPSALTSVLTWIGTFWVAAFVYLFLAVLILDALRAANHFLPFFPGFVTENYARAKYVTTGIIFGAVVLTLIGGYINARTLRVTELEISINKQAGELKNLNIVVVADTHIGTIVGSSWVKQIVDKINALSPDIVLLPGDILDNREELLVQKGIGEELRRIQARYGVFAALGNHEYICCGGEGAIRYLTERNITVLRDQSIKIDNSFFLVGRDDYSMERWAGRKRKDLKDLMEGIDSRFPIILLDHQPYNLHEAAENGVDLQVSGHTHCGQFWPFNYIVEALFELAWGYKRTGDTHYYVTNGAAVWGPPVRVGSRPEIVFIRLNFE